MSAPTSGHVHQAVRKFHDHVNGGITAYVSSRAPFTIASRIHQDTSATRGIVGERRHKRRPAYTGVSCMVWRLSGFLSTPGRHRQVRHRGIAFPRALVRGTRQQDRGVRSSCGSLVRSGGRFPHDRFIRIGFTR